jgi:hypothetical protein
MIATINGDDLNVEVVNPEGALVLIARRVAVVPALWPSPKAISGSLADELGVSVRRLRLRFE